MLENEKPEHHLKDELSPEQIDKGWHYCPDFDFMLISPAMPEIEACLCDLVSYKAKHGTAAQGLKRSLNKYIKKEN